MTPTLAGRIQTRWALLSTVGVAWTALILPFLRAGDPLRLAATLLTALAVTAVLGTGWELAYHAGQQLRWEKDWPTLFGLLTGLVEGVVVALALPHVPWTADVDVGRTFVVHFATTWVLVWLVANGPVRIVALRWRFRGGRFL